jgi:hypothetical protein
MKKIKIVCLSLVAMIALSCKQDFLEDMKSYDKFDESIFTNETQAGMFIDRIYNDYFAAYKSPIVSVVGLYNDTRTRLTEEIGGTVPDMINSQKTLIDAAQADGYYGNALSSGVQNNPYSRIRNGNILLSKIDQLGQSLSEQFRNRARGQMFFLRGLQYFDLFRIYGGVPIVTTVEDASADDESIKLPRAKPSEVIAQIVKDFDSAAVLLPATWDGANYGRYTSAAALAMKSRVLLTYASPLFNTDWDNPGNDRWQKALAAGLAAETALTAAGYGLFGTSAKDWAEMWYRNDNAFNKEAIMVRLLSSSTALSGIESNGWERSIRVTKQTGNGGVSAPKEMIDLFPMKDGARPVVGTNYDSTLFFMDRDPRFYRTFAFSGMKWPTKENTNETIWLYRWKATPTSTTATYSDGNNVSSPAVVRKMTNPPAASTVAGLAFSGTDIFEYRYAELILNIAECYAATGNIANCLTYLGKIRARVGIPSANNYGIGTLASKYAAIEACLYERRIELAYEGKRFWDAQRWMLYNDDAASGDNTNAKLGIPVINGTTRTGRQWQYKNNASGSTDPLASARGTISIDPDASDFNTQLAALKTFYQTNIITVPTDQPLDRNGNTPLFITFRQNYYISGLNTAALSTNPWLLQTIGWNDYNGAPGTFNYKQ